MEEYRIVLDEEQNEERIDVWLARFLQDFSRSALQKHLKEGHILLNGKKVKASTICRAGDEVILDLPEPEEPDILPEEMPLDILYEDDDLIFINKPKGMVVHPAPGHPDGTLVNGLLFHCRGKLSGINGVLRPGIVHRIDQDTTGVIVACKNDMAHRKVAEQLAVHSITRA